MGEGAKELRPLDEAALEEAVRLGAEEERRLAEEDAQKTGERIKKAVEELQDFAREAFGLAIGADIVEVDGDQVRAVVRRGGRLYWLYLEKGRWSHEGDHVPEHLNAWAVCECREHPVATAEVTNLAELGVFVALEHPERCDWCTSPEFERLADEADVRPESAERRLVKAFLEILEREAREEGGVGA